MDQGQGRAYLKVLCLIKITYILHFYTFVNSALTLPVTIKCMEEKYHLNKTVVQFVLPLGMAINMNGTAMYYPMVALLVAQMQGMEVTMQMLITLWQAQINIFLYFA